ncbi:sigma-54-dependent transcriptional regulator [Trichlorobacter ammonificans]|uniref:DNA-binding transcriptional regulator NtrC n=1 Tax=Trichlorobacter ammonificans TaxID=2916410 RepID=A0ABN8HLR0_9BACT|nr:sigma-54 dependent transcriptional regulator [Trichlorobacter ammonificans]CAH2032573.1 Transcriptional regulatory protein ZraR [Trichlorobacter ammonificans]
MACIYICDDEQGILRYLSKLLKTHGYAVESFTGGRSLLARLEAAPGVPALLLQDVRMPDLDGIEVLKRVRRLAPELPVVVMTAHGTVDDAVHAIKLGAYDYVMKPFPKEKILGVLARALEHRQLTEENRRLRDELQRGDDTPPVFASPRFRQVYDLTLQVAASDANILILGESGTGKELIARTVHGNSLRRSKPFVSLNCAALADSLLESQLFGHMRGAFTGAVLNQKGLLEEADGGTLFLDEIGDVSAAVQAKLLRVIQEKEFIPIGATRARTVDVRFVAATNRDLQQEVAEGRFREDLYYRLNVISLTIPPLRERPEDVAPLAHHFLRRFAARMKKEVHGIEPEALRSLGSYHWPGNVRELENVIERAVILARGSLLTADLLPVCSRPAPAPAADEAVPALSLDELERRHILGVYRHNGGHKSKTAEILGISRKTLDRKLAEYGVQ